VYFVTFITYLVCKNSFSGVFLSDPWLPWCAETRLCANTDTTSESKWEPFAVNNHICILMSSNTLIVPFCWWLLLFDLTSGGCQGSFPRSEGFGEILVSEARLSMVS
jgi:hypothetical protein